MELSRLSAWNFREAIDFNKEEFAENNVTTISEEFPNWPTPPKYFTISLWYDLTFHLGNEQMSTSAEIRTAIRVLEEFKRVDPDITLPSMLAFLYYVERDDQSGNQNAMEQRLEMSTATASRATSHWLEWKRPRCKGLDMLESIPDPEDRRYKKITLKRRGLILAERIKLAVQEYLPN